VAVKVVVVTNGPLDLVYEFVPVPVQPGGDTEQLKACILNQEIFIESPGLIVQAV
jgi:hypothetical protein